jgi:hypothetical protein
VYFETCNVSTRSALGLVVSTVHFESRNVLPFTVVAR